jgi:hypothetical protein
VEGKGSPAVLWFPSWNLTSAKHSPSQYDNVRVDTRTSDGWELVQLWSVRFLWRGGDVGRGKRSHQRQRRLVIRLVYFLSLLGRKNACSDLSLVQVRWSRCWLLFPTIWSLATTRPSFPVPLLPSIWPLSPLPTQKVGGRWFKVSTLWSTLSWVSSRRCDWHRRRLSVLR